MNTDSSEGNGDIWSELSATWKAGGSEPSEVLASRLERRVRRLNLRSRIVFTTEILVTVFAVFSGGYLMISRSGWPDQILGMLAVLFALSAIYFSIKVRRSAWGRPGDAPAAHLEALLGHLRAGIELARLNDYLCYAGFAFVGVAYFASAQPDASDGGREMLIPIALLFLLCCYVGGRFYRQRKTRELARLTRIQRESGD